MFTFCAQTLTRSAGWGSSHDNSLDQPGRYSRAWTKKHHPLSPYTAVFPMGSLVRWFRRVLASTPTPRRPRDTQPSTNESRALLLGLSSTPPTLITHGRHRMDRIHSPPAPRPSFMLRFTAVRPLGPTIHAPRRSHYTHSKPPATANNSPQSCLT